MAMRDLQGSHPSPIVCPVHGGCRQVPAIEVANEPDAPGLRCVAEELDAVPCPLRRIASKGCGTREIHGRRVREAHPFAALNGACRGFVGVEEVSFVRSPFGWRLDCAVQGIVHAEDENRSYRNECSVHAGSRTCHNPMHFNLIDWPMASAAQVRKCARSDFRTILDALPIRRDSSGLGAGRAHRPSLLECHRRGGGVGQENKRRRLPMEEIIRALHRLEGEMRSTRRRRPARHL